MSETWETWLQSIHPRAVVLVGRRRPGLETIPWDPGDADRRAAWTYASELLTRVTTEPLGYRSGDEEAALNSVYQLFGHARSLLAEYGPDAQHFAVLAAATLARIRPFTSSWHRQQLAGRLGHQDNRRLFRRDLDRLQTDLAVLAKAFDRLGSGHEGLYQFRAAGPRSSGLTWDRGRVWPHTLLGTERLAPGVAETILNAELEWVTARRRVVAAHADPLGGLGSASDHSVTDGGDGGRGTAENNDCAAGGSSASMGLVGLAISGGGIRSATFALGALQSLGQNGVLDDVDYMSTVSGGGFIGSHLSARIAESANEDAGGDPAKQEGRQVVSPHLIPDDGNLDTEGVRWIRNRSKYLEASTWPGRFEAFWRLLPHPLVVAAAVVTLGGLTLALGRTERWLALLAMAVLAIALSRFDLNRWSYHRLYRNRLAATYLASSANPKGRGPKLTAIRGSDGAPYHLVCAAVNLPASRNRELRGRRSDFFTFSPLYCGSVLTGYGSTAELEAGEPNLDLGTVMAVSGAAISPHMGTMARLRVLRVPLLLTGLSFWLRNPGQVGNASRRRLGWTQFWRGAAGRLTETDDFVNLSDGGHIDNLGLYELVRRQCKLIICIDGERDPEQRCTGLVKACRFAWIDLGANIQIDLEELRRDPETGVSQAHFSLGTIDYGRGPDGNRRIGYLLYLKLSVTGNERAYVGEYRDRHPTFPHQSTVDQFFDEDQFEAYRALGAHAANDLFAEELVGCHDPLGRQSTRTWLGALVAATDPAPPQSVPV